jgi:hypothetical protein
VKKVLYGHLWWICHLADRGVDRFAAHHWPNGQSIYETRWLPPATLVDTPLQMIKVLYCLGLEGKVDREVVIPYWVRKGLGSKVDHWIKSLHILNERGTYVFTRSPTGEHANIGSSEESSDIKYSLADHVLIGLALRCVEALGLSSSKHPRAFYPYDEVRKKALKRFTTENPISGQKMLATSRWADSSRFLLHSRDTILFSSASLEYLKDPSRVRMYPSRKRPGLKHDEVADTWNCVDQRWAKLLDSQAFHGEFQVLQWDKPLWYALVVILGCKGIGVNGQPLDVMTNKALTVLLRSSTYNGLFPGLLDQNQVPVVYDSELDRDVFWFSTFEVPHVLWIYRNTKDLVTTKGTHGSPGAVPMANRDVPKIGKQVGKYVPFTNLGSSKDQLGLDVLSDDWLQAPPPVLNLNVKGRAQVKLPVNTDPKQVFSRYTEVPSLGRIGAVVDVPKWSRGTEIARYSQSAQEMLAALTRRSIWKSKKRVVWLSCRDRSLAVKIYQRSLSAEKTNMLSFLQRHAKSEQYFFDSAVAATNEWETELHLSFFQLTTTDKTYLHQLEASTCLASATMSLRFFGDFSDRFWTCHFLEHGPDSTSSVSLAERLLPDSKCGINDGMRLTDEHREYEPGRRRKLRGSRTKPWQQRRILELLIYSKMLEDLHMSTSKIFLEIRRLALRLNNNTRLDLEKDPFKKGIEEAVHLQKLVNEDQYFSIASQWRKYIPVLLVIEDNLGVNLEKTREWSRRQKDRKSQQPRWTKADEENQRTTLSKMEVYTQRQARDLERLKGQIQSFRESLPSQLESLREDINFRGSQSINLFTYVTVVFLPLGFATGLLSMSGVPGYSLLMHLVTLALAALGITLFALLNAPVGKALVTPLTRVYRQAPQFLWQATKYAFFHKIAVIHYERSREKSKEDFRTSLLALVVVPSIVATRIATSQFVSQQPRQQGTTALTMETSSEEQLPSPERQSQPLEVATSISPTGEASPNTRYTNNRNPPPAGVSPKSAKTRDIDQLVGTQDPVNYLAWGDDPLSEERPASRTASRQHSIQSEQRDALWEQYLSHLVSRKRLFSERHAVLRQMPELQSAPQNMDIAGSRARVYSFRAWFTTSHPQYEELMRFSYRAAVRDFMTQEITVFPMPNKVLAQMERLCKQKGSIGSLSMSRSTIEPDLEKGVARWSTASSRGRPLNLSGLG